ncbi:MAG TPA: M23 family metallopeptidase, partial [Allocoleopsis sp.]
MKLKLIFVFLIMLMLIVLPPQLTNVLAQNEPTGRFCNVQKNGGWWIWYIPNSSADPCKNLLTKSCTDSGCKVVNSGKYLLYGKNRVNLKCEGLNTSFTGEGDQPINRAFQTATNPFKNSCNFKITTLSSVNPNNRNLTKIPLFEKPFRGDYLVGNFVDHDVPQQFKDHNGYLLNYQGKKMKIGTPGAGIDGHEGYDFSMKEGTALFAVADGKITFAGEGVPFNCPILGGKKVTGLYVYILHTASNGEKFESEYAHLSRIDVQKNQFVKSGQMIGISGNTGCSTGPHLHFQVHRL